VRFLPFLAVTTSLLLAQEISYLFSKVKESPFFLKEKTALEAQFLEKKAQPFNQNYRLNLSTGYAKPDDGSGKGEVEIGIGRDFYLKKDVLKNYFLTQEEYYNFLQKVTLAKLKGEIWRLYGNYCIKMKALQAKGSLGVVYDEIARHIDKGVRLGEFSASDSIMAHLALDNLNLQISELESELAEIEARLRSIIPTFNGDFLCTQHLKPNTDKLFYPQNSYLWKMLKSKQKALKSELALHRNLRDIGVDLALSKEIDTTRAVVGISIPFYKGVANEAQKKAILKNLHSAIQTLHALEDSYAQESRALKQRLNIYFEHVSKTEDSIKLSANTLIEQSQMRFKAGEESLFGMLKAIETKLSMIETILDLKIRRHNAVADYMQKYAVEIERILK